MEVLPRIILKLLNHEITSVMILFKWGQSESRALDSPDAMCEPQPQVKIRTKVRHTRTSLTGSMLSLEKASSAYRHNWSGTNKKMVKGQRADEVCASCHIVCFVWNSFLWNTDYKFVQETPDTETGQNNKYT